MSKKTILIVEDEDDLRGIMIYNLEREGYKVMGVDSGEEGLKIAKTLKPDLLLLDLMLPSLSGLDVCRELKKNKETDNLPIIMVSAKGEESDIVCGLELGADDYVTKPYSPRVLLARISALLRRSKATEIDDDEISIDALRINRRKHRVIVDEKEIELTKSEFSLLYFLVSNRGWVFTRSQIVSAIKGDRYIVTERAIDVQIVGLRKKIKSYGALIESVRGIGYKFKE